ncbi:hypothetical protein DVH05_008595 [Phytophthora capsici]|nr:hypothetical protein DVH05_008595 [Phytophthora capsici]
MSLKPGQTVAACPHHGSSTREGSGTTMDDKVKFVQERFTPEQAINYRKTPNWSSTTRTTTAQTSWSKMAAQVPSSPASRSACAVVSSPSSAPDVGQAGGCAGRGRSSAVSYAASWWAANNCSVKSWPPRIASHGSRSQGWHP